MMNEEMKQLADRLIATHRLSAEEYEKLIVGRDEELAEYLAKAAVAEQKRIYGNEIFIRGLLEISNICKNDCIYCGIRRSNRNCERYRLTEEEIFYG